MRPKVFTRENIISSQTMMTDVESPSEALVPIYQAAKLRIPDHCNLPNILQSGKKVPLPFL
jgi:hypothetical protein